MAVNSKILGVVLAGGRSSRMGVNKVFMNYKGVSLVDRARAMLEKMPEISKTVVSGTPEHIEAVADRRPYDGPAQAMLGIIEQLPDYDGYMFVPVDMPLLTAIDIRHLIQTETSGSFEGWPLPAFIKRPQYLEPLQEIRSVRDLLDAVGSSNVTPTRDMQAHLFNVNTPEDWQKLEAS